MASVGPSKAGFGRSGEECLRGAGFKGPKPLQAGEHSRAACEVTSRFVTVGRKNAEAHYPRGRRRGKEAVPASMGAASVHDQRA